MDMLHCQTKWQNG